MEVWKDIKDYEGLYQVSNLGRVKSVKRDKVLCETVSNRYPHLLLYKNGVRITVSVHRLVAQAFIPNPNNYPQVNHKDEVKTNNTADNLEWCTSKYNMNYGTYPQRLVAITKKIAEVCAIPVIQKTLDGEIIKTYKSRMEAERQTGIDHSSICACVKGKKKAVGGFIWEEMRA